MFFHPATLSHPANTIRFRLRLLAFFAVSVIPLHGQIIIRKTAEDQNPPLYLASFNGPADVQRMLVETLRRCDWFRVVSQPATDGYVLNARWEAAGQPQILFQLSKGGQTIASFRQAGSAQDQRRLIHQAVDTLIEKTFSNPGPCDSRIAMVQASQGKKEVVTCNFDGSDMTRLTHNGSISTEPAWSANGRDLVYTLYSGTTTSIVQVDVKAGRQRKIAHFPGLNAGAALSPDGRMVALCLSRDKQVDLYIMQMADGKLQRLTRDIAVESSPTWSPDGRQICYVSDRAGGRPQLSLIPASGGTPKNLLSDFDESVSPDWSPVSNKICFATRQGSQYVIAVVDMAGNDRQKRIVSNAAGDFESPSWGPDGRHLVCSQTVSGGRILCMVDSWSGRMMPITQPGSLSLPSWGRKN